MAAETDGWAGMGWDWTDVGDIRRRLDEGADPERWSGGRPLHRAAVFGSREVVSELAGRVADVDALEDGVTALWEDVVSRRPDNARALAAAGADPISMSWSATDEVSAHAVALADSIGLVCFDPQQNRIRP